MPRRLCQYCRDPLSRWAKVLHIYCCRNCAYRMSMGTSPSRPRDLTTTTPASDYGSGAVEADPSPTSPVLGSEQRGGRPTQGAAGRHPTDGSV